MSPSYGRALEAVRLAGLSSPQNDSTERAQQDQGGHWVTIDHRHVFIRETWQRIAQTARKYNGSSVWAYSKRKDNFPANTDKCNKYVYDVTKEAGAEARTKGSKGKMRPLLAGEWANPSVSIPNWRVLAPAERPQPGDVAAYPLPGHATCTGHSGIVTSVDADGTVHAIAAHADVVGPDDKFQSTNKRVLFRRYSGGR
jgi:hypothetical protein